MSGGMVRVRASVSRLAQGLIRAQIQIPWAPLVACGLIAVVASLLALRLELRTRFDQMLPDRQPSVIELRRVEQHIAVGQNVAVVLEGADQATLRAMGDALLPALRSIGSPWVTDARDGVQGARAFLEPRAALFLRTDELRRLEDDIDARWDWEIGRVVGSNLDDDDAPPPLQADALRSRFQLAKDERFPDGYYQSKDGQALVVIVHSAVGAGELDLGKEALRRVKEVVGRVGGEPRFASVRAGYAGDLVTGLAEYGAVRDDLVDVGVLGVGLVLGVVFVFFLRLRVLLAMGLTIGAGLACTFGLTRLAIGHLNVATGFLVSIVAGNGINFGIIYMGRFYEELRRGASSEQALRVAHASTWLPTLTAAIAAAASYGSLGVTEFRAFKHFAFIGAAGMLACWLMTYAMLPPLLLLLERARPFVKEATPRTAWGRLRLRGVRFEQPFVYAAARAPRAIAWIGGALAVAGLVALVPYLRADPLEYNMRHLQNDLGASKEMYRVSEIVSEVVGNQVGSSMVVLCDRIEQVPALERALDARRDAAPAGERPFEAAHSLFDFVPPDQARKLPMAEAIRERLVRAHERGFVSDADWREIEPVLPPPNLAPWTIADLPMDLAQPFTERDGTRGRLVLIEPTAGKSDSDLRYLLRWANSFRETRLDDGSVVRGSGRAVIFADMLEAVQRDMPRAVALSLALTLLAVLVTFGAGAGSVAVLGALFLGLGWIAAAMALGRLKLDFFNFIALPITFGIGVDYAVNVVQRYRADRTAGMLPALREAGGPVILCSLTTMLGYMALLTSINRAIRGLGLLAVFGEVACLLAAVLVVPAAFVWRERRSRHDRGAPAPAASDRAAPPNDALPGT